MFHRKPVSSAGIQGDPWGLYHGFWKLELYFLSLTQSILVADFIHLLWICSCGVLPHSPCQPLCWLPFTCFPLKAAKSISACSVSWAFSVWDNPGSHNILISKCKSQTLGKRGGLTSSELRVFCIKIHFNSKIEYSQFKKKQNPWVLFYRKTLKYLNTLFVGNE